MNAHATRNQLWGKLTALRIDIKLRKIAGEQSESLRQAELQALQVAVQLRAECNKVLQ